ncbi:hypothetical protein [Arundinibacter roseus]|uniref:TonB C-terminal domain-containing protein n=1 Tax=Arundinibacter roseus TaxID=2070510 RepID=A0A4R4KDI5_9BACT|nr:hypothetical protein [Arundinibacter roseus]TDB65908.1 hypothetical protein EZE20_09070 [Arundinibacter roseus]
MNTNIFFTFILLCFWSAVHAQTFDTSFTEAKMKSKNQVYKVKKYSTSSFLENEKNQLHKQNYRPDTLNLSGMKWRESMVIATKEILVYVSEKRKISLDNLPNIFVTWKILKNGQVKEVRFAIPNDNLLTADDFEEIERIITKQKVKITHPHYYKNINYISILMPLRWKDPLR